MRISNSHRRQEQGNVIVVSLLVAGIVGYLLASYLSLVSGQNLATARSQSWNSCIPVLEAGIEEALTHLQYATVLTNLGAGTTNLASDGWVLSGTNFVKQRDFGNRCSFTVMISVTTPP